MMLLLPKLLFNYFVFIFFSEIYFKDLSTRKELPIRDVKANSIGRLISVRGIVMRSTEVKPMVVVATYSCDLCGGETYQPVCIYIFIKILLLLNLILIIICLTGKFINI